MLILPSVPSGTTIFCDDVRHEQSGQKTLVGIYRDALRIPDPPPVTIIKLFAVSTIKLDQRDLPEKVQIKILFEDEALNEREISSVESVLPKGTAHKKKSDVFAESDGAYFATLTTEACLVDLPVEKNGRLKVRMRIEDEVYALGSIRILFAAESAQN